MDKMTIDDKYATTREVMVGDLKALGIQPGGTLLVHSSLKSLGHVSGGAEEVIRALQEAVTPQGTLLLPAFSYEEINDKQPRFDVRATKVCVGAIPETFRKMDGVIRSLHPTHSVAAWGREAEAITRGHERHGTPCGPDSPLHRIVQRKGQILFLGVTTICNTTLHGVEEWAGITESLTEGTQALEVVDYSGKVIPVPSHRHAGERSNFYAKMEPLYLREGIMRVGKVGSADCRLLDSARMTEFTLACLKRHRDLFAHHEIPRDA